MLLDLDDTILEDATVSERCWERVCAEFSPLIEAEGCENLLPVVQEVRRWFGGTFSEAGGVGATLPRRGGRFWILALAALGSKTTAGGTTWLRVSTPPSWL